MVNIAILCVNYNSYNELNNYVESIDIAAKIAANKVFVDVYIADNSDIKQDIETKKYASINSYVFPYNQNLGYIGAIMQLIKEIGDEKIKRYDYVIFSNVDLLLSDSFFVNLIQTDYPENIGWIAPRIKTIGKNKEENPFIMNRPTTFKIKMLKLYYSSSLIYILYQFFYQFRHKDRKKMTLNNKIIKIYAGHGSIMIFTKSFIYKNYNFNFPGFMYGEEIFFAELSRIENLNVIYCPYVSVFNIGGVSTKLYKVKLIRKFNKNSLKLIEKLFYS